MAVSFTYDDFLKQMQGSGQNFSAADLQLAKENPNAGMGILDAKIKYSQAKTAAERAKYNQQAEQIRSLYGGYYGGVDGSGYTPMLSPNDYVEPERPTFSFSWNAETDPSYQAYRKQYIREGNRATQDALGAAAAATGGIPSSYATAAATQAGDYYASQLTDKVPQLYEAAYSRAYNQYLNDLSQWNADRSFGYGQLIDEINTQTSNRQEALQNALYGAQLGDYGKLEDLGFDVSNVPEDYNRLYNLAILAGQYGDYDKLKELLGITASEDLKNNASKAEEQQKLEMMYNLAIAQANLGDTTYLNQLISQYFKK